MCIKHGGAASTLTCLTLPVFFRATYSATTIMTMISKPHFTVHTSTLFDPKRKAFTENVSVTVDPQTGSIVSVKKRASAEIEELGPDDIDIRGKVAMPGFVDAHTHIFLHDYK